MNAKEPIEKKSKHSPTDLEDEGLADDFKPMTAQQAQAWRAKYPSLSVWRLVMAQLLVGLLLVVLVLCITQQSSLTYSAAYGVLVVVLPAAVFARGVTRMRGAAKGSMGAFAVWEFAKIILAIVLMVAAPKIINDLNWLMMIAAMIVIMNVSWVALLRRPKSV